MFKIQSPFLRIDINTEEEIFYDRKKAHLCSEGKDFFLNYENKAKKSNDKKKLTFCYAPRLNLGSIIGLQKDETKVEMETYPSGYILSKNIQDFVLGSFLNIDKYLPSKTNKLDKNKKYF